MASHPGFRYLLWLLLLLIAAPTGGVAQSLIPQSGWSVMYVDSRESACENGSATNAIDGNPNSYWATKYCGGTAPMPHEIRIDLGAYYNLSAFQYLPRQNGCANGWIKQYEFYVSTDGVDWGTPAAAGNFDYTGYATSCPGAGIPPAFSVAFPATVARYIRLRAMSEVHGNPWTVAAEINLVGTLTSAPIASVVLQNGWSVIYVDSQESACENGSAVNAIDGNPNSYWVTKYCGSTAPMPHEMQIDLGAYYNLSAFQYLPRQNGCANGWIEQYEFYVSTDGVNWGTPAAAGSFDYTGYATSCPGAGKPPAFSVAFPVNVARYIRMRALSEVNGHPWTVAAEINVVGTLASGPSIGISQLTLSPSMVLGGSFTTATVTLTAAAPSGGALVNLSSSNPAAVSMPASLFIPAGANSGEFLAGSLGGASSAVNISGTYNGITQTATLNIVPGSPVPQDGWSVIYVDSQERTCENGSATNAIDGNPSSYWATQYCGGVAPMPHEIQVDLGAYYNLSGFQYLPRQNGCANGWIRQYEFYVSSDGVNWGPPAATGSFDYTGYATTCPGAGKPPAYNIAFPATMARYIRLRALSEVNGNSWTVASEINVFSFPLAPLALTLNPTTVVGGNAAIGTVSLTAPAPADGVSVDLSSTNPALANVPASLVIPAGADSASFPITTNVVNTLTTVDILASYGGATQGSTLTVTPAGLIPRQGWSVIYVDSQESACENGAAANAIDGNPNTYWVTQYCGGTAPMPHEIQLDLGAYYNLSAFQYLPRQNGCANGWIKQYEVYVSTDGVNWDTPAATGSFDYTGYATSCPGAGKPPAFSVAFPATVARYIRLRALSEVNGNPWTVAAELNVLGDVQPGLSLSIAGLDFPDQLLSTASTPLPIALTNVGLSPVGITGISSFGDFTQTNNCGSGLPALGSCAINVIFTPQVAGYRSARLTVQNTASGLLEIPLSGNGVIPAVSLSSASAVFGPQLLNTTGAAPSIDLLSVGTAPLLVSNLAVSGDFRQANNCVGALAPGQLCTIQLFFTPTAIGARASTLTVFDNTAAGTHAISMSGVGVNKHNVNLSWTASTSPVTGYFVYRATQSGGPYTELQFVPQPQTSFVDSLPGGATYFYVVTAVDANQIESVTSSEVTATIPAP